MTKTGQQIADWALQNLVIPPGHPDSGSPFTLAPYFLEAFNDAFLPGVIECGVSLPRGNAKTSSAAALFLWLLCSDEYTEGARYAIMATNGTIAGKVRDLIMEIAEASGLPVRTKYDPQPGKILVDGRNIEIQMMNASKSAFLGAGLDVCYADEFGEFEPDKHRRTVDMANSSLAKRGGVMIATGVQAWSPLFQEMKERADRPTTVWHEYSGLSNLPVDNRDNLRRANPGIAAGILSEVDLMTAAVRVKGAPASETNFRTYHLNLQAQERKELLIDSRRFTDRVVTEELPPRLGKCSLGVDIGYSESHTAYVAFWPESGRAELGGAVPVGEKWHRSDKQCPCYC